jgi:hypothetical protein
MPCCCLPPLTHCTLRRPRPQSMFCPGTSPYACCSHCRFHGALMRRRTFMSCADMPSCEQKRRT